uniref:Tyr recombinase domain-containing protein n=1 Tax=Plectus sambesii TaxID=2011161 RepID=A0A914V7W6_9BILA
MSEHMQVDLRAAGVITSPEKCIWNPVQRLDWLGITIDLHQFQLEVSTKRITSALNLIDSLLCTICPSARDRMRITGKLISMASVLGCIVQLKTRRLYEAINAVFPNIYRRFMFASTEHDELTFWKRSLHALNVCSLHQSAGADRIYVAGGSIATAAGSAPDERRETVSSLRERGEIENYRQAVAASAPMSLIAADASATAAGAVYYDSDGRKHVASTSFNTAEAAQSSTYREVKTILFALESFSPLIKGRRVVIQTDNKGAVAIINKGSGLPVLQSLAERIYNFGVSSGCKIIPVWVPRELNAEADEASRIVDYDNWGVKTSFFRICQHKWGPHSVDRFADHHNAKLPRFNSKYYVPGSEAVDAFACHWGGEMNWLCPPISLIVRTIRHLSSKVARLVQAAAANPAICPAPAQVQDLLRASKADRTETSYLAIITRFVAWRDAMLCGDSTLDGPTAVALFLAKEHARTSGKTEVARSALVWYIDLVGGQPNPARDPIPVAISQGSLRRAPPIVHHDRVTEDEIKLIFQLFTGPSLPLSDHRIGTVLTLMFSAFLRVSEVVALERSDVKFDSSHVWLTIRKSKTDQLGKAERRPIARSGGPFCAVANLERWLVRVPQTTFLFPCLSTVQSTATKPMSVDLVRAELRRVLQVCGITRSLTPHSFRGGAATLAIQRGVPTRAVMAMGRWASTGGFAPYVEVNAKTLAGADQLL